MTLGEAISSRKRLAIAVMRYHERLAAEVYIVEGGVAFLDIGWSELGASSFRAHLMRGAVEGSGPWRVGSWRIREIDPETDPQYVEEWARWEPFKAETNATRERGAAYASEHLGVEIRL